MPSDRHARARRTSIVELAQLAGRPSLLDPRARTGRVLDHPATACGPGCSRRPSSAAHPARLIPAARRPARDSPGGPDRRPPNGDVLLARRIPRRNGHPHNRLNPDIDPEAKALIDRFACLTPASCRSCCFRSGHLLANPGEVELARCIVLSGHRLSERLYDVAVVGSGPAASPPMSMPRRKVLAVLCSIAVSLGGPAGARPRDLPRFSDRHQPASLTARAYHSAEVRGRDGGPCE